MFVCVKKKKKKKCFLRILNQNQLPTVCGSEDMAILKFFSHLALLLGH